MTDDTCPALPMAQTCEHFYASHCYRGMSVRLCVLCHEPDWDDLAGQLDAARGVESDASVPAVTSPATEPADRSAAGSLAIVSTSPLSLDKDDDHAVE